MSDTTSMTVREAMKELRKRLTDNSFGLRSWSLRWSLDTKNTVWKTISFGQRALPWRRWLQSPSSQTRKTKKKQPNRAPFCRAQPPALGASTPMRGPARRSS